MNPEVLLDHPAVVAALAAIMGFLVPVMRALQAALIRRIDQAWPADGDDDHEERIRKTVERVRTRVPLPRSFIERHVRVHKSGAPPPL